MNKHLRNKRLSFEKYCPTVGLSTRDYYIGRTRVYEFPETADAYDAWCAAYNMQQAEIDRLMLEFCPGEMTSQQIKEWGNAQKRAPEPYQKNFNDVGEIK